MSEKKRGTRRHNRYSPMPSNSLLDWVERRGKYIVIEGIDGSGKTTIARWLGEELKSRGERTVIVREPWTEEIKSLLSKNPNIHPLAEAYLFAADRMLLHSTVIARALREGKTVVGDRSFIASLVYQVVRGADEETVEMLNKYALRPDLIVLLDIDAETAWKRINSKKKKQLQHLEKKEMLETLRRRYLEVVSRIEPTKSMVVNAREDVEKIVSRIIDEMRERGLLKKHFS